MQNRLPAQKRRPGESVWKTAQRMVDSKLAAYINVKLAVGQEDITEEEKESPSYPALMSVYRKHFIDCSVEEGKKEVPAGI